MFQKTSYIFEELRKVFDEGGATAVKFFVDKQLNDWKNVKINVAVTGSSGTGKSSFINAVLGLTADDEGAAPVGVTETTQDKMAYPHPCHPNLVLWDLPGLGTPNFSREKFEKKVNLPKFDFFIFLTANRFLDDDLWLAEKIINLKKHFYFARNKVDQEIRNNKKSHPKTHDEKEVKDKMRRNCEQTLQKLKTDRPVRVYLIDTFETDKYDFGELMDTLIRDAPEKKRESFVLSMTFMTDTLIEEKREILSDRIHYMSLLSGISGAVPVPILDSAVDIGILVEEAIFYRDQLGLSDETLQAYANWLEMSIEELTNNLDLKSRIIQFSAKGLATYLTKKGAKKAATLSTAKYLKFFLPMFGNIASGSASYTMTSWCLHDLLEVMVEDAKKINEHKLKFSK